MIQSVVVTFNFDSETQKVSDVKCTVGETEAKKKRTTKKTSEVVVLEDKAMITLDSAKLSLNHKAAADLGVIGGESRLAVKWEKEGNVLIPIIGTDIAFSEEGSGNKVTKTNTVAYKGKANAVLAEYGSEFSIEPYKDEKGLWKLISSKSSGTITSPSVDEKSVEKQADNTEADILVNTDTVTEIDEMEFKL